MLGTGFDVLCLDLSVVKSYFAPGVGLPCPAQGLSDLEIIEIAHEIGQ